MYKLFSFDTVLSIVLVSIFIQRMLILSSDIILRVMTQVSMNILNHTNSCRFAYKSHILGPAAFRSEAITVKKCYSP
jgi:hypothetical protein